MYDSVDSMISMLNDKITVQSSYTTQLSMYIVYKCIVIICDTTILLIDSSYNVNKWDRIVKSNQCLLPKADCEKQTAHRDSSPG